MSRFSNYEADRKSNLAARSAKAHAEKVAKWLAANPEIGVLNGGKYYKILEGEVVSVKELAA